MLLFTKNSRWMWLCLSLLALAMVIVYLGSAENTIDVQRRSAISQPPPVSIEVLTVQPETAIVTTWAEVRPRWATELRAAVSGRVEKVFDHALAGEQVGAGTILLAIENTPYKAAVAAAELELQQAQLALSQAQKATTVMKRQFDRDGKQPPNDLAILLPQLRIAEATVDTAQVRLIATKQQLRDATVTAPFSGFVTQRVVSPGQMVSVGEALLRLVDDSNFELTAEIGRSEWQLLAHPLAGQKADVLDQSGGIRYRATVRQGGGFLDENSRLFKIFLEIEDSNHERVLSGDFVRIQLAGVTMPRALNVPESALTQEGYLWYLDDDDRLQRMSPRILFRKHDRIVIEAPISRKTWRIAVTPLVSFLPGQSVTARPKGM